MKTPIISRALFTSVFALERLSKSARFILQQVANEYFMDEPSAYDGNAEIKRICGDSILLASRFQGNGRIPAIKALRVASGEDEKLNKFLCENYPFDMVESMNYRLGKVLNLCGAKLLVESFFHF